MQFKDGAIRGVLVRELAQHADKRGWLIEMFRADEVGSDFLPAMSYVSSTAPGVVRGPHEHRDQADFFCFLGPRTSASTCGTTGKSPRHTAARWLWKRGKTHRGRSSFPPGLSTHTRTLAQRTVGRSTSLIGSMRGRAEGRRSTKSGTRTIQRRRFALSELARKRWALRTDHL